jgi:hypothetical protein
MSRFAAPRFSLSFNDQPPRAFRAGALPDDELSLRLDWRRESTRDAAWV